MTFVSKTSGPMRTHLIPLDEYKESRFLLGPARTSKMLPALFCRCCTDYAERLRGPPAP